MPAFACLHCGHQSDRERRGLCRRCYDDPSVRGLYPQQWRNLPAVPTVGGFAQPAEPTAAPPGTEERIRVLEERAAGGLSLWHPDDATLFGT